MLICNKPHDLKRFSFDISGKFSPNGLKEMGILFTMHLYRISITIYDFFFKRKSIAWKLKLYKYDGKCILFTLFC